MIDRSAKRCPNCSFPVVSELETDELGGERRRSPPATVDGSGITAFLLRDHGRRRRCRADAHGPATTNGPGATIVLLTATTVDALTSKGRIGTELPPTGDTDRTRAEALYGAASQCRGARHKYQPDQQTEFMCA
jgi:hypothetical protein